MRLLSTAGIFNELPGRRFTLTPVGRCLRSDEPQSLRDTAIMTGDSWQMRGYEYLHHSVRTGQDAITAAYGTLTAKWDMTARQTPAPPLPPPVDGVYTIHMELADSDSSQAAQNNEGSFTFNRNGVASTPK